MANPISRDLMVTGPLANVSIAYRNRSYIGDRVFPILDGIDPKAKIARYLKGAWFSDEAQMRAPGARAARGGYPVDFINISTIEYAMAKEVTDDDRRNARSVFAPPLRPDQDALEWCANAIDLKKERLIASMVIGGTWSSVAGEDAQGGWAAASGSNTFILDVETRIETIRSNTGLRPNVLVVCGGTMSKLRQCPDVLDRIKYVERGIISAPLIAAIFDLDEVLVGDAVVNTAKETKAGDHWTSSNVWEKNAGKGSAFLFYRPSSPGLKTASAGYQARIHYENGLARRTTSWREPAEHKDVYEVAEELDIVQTGADLGFLWYDTIAD